MHDQKTLSLNFILCFFMSLCFNIKIPEAPVTDVLQNKFLKLLAKFTGNHPC